MVGHLDKKLHNNEMNPQPSLCLVVYPHSAFL